MMYMTPFKMLLLRFYNVTLGRTAFFNKILRKALVIFLIKKKKNNIYCASSKFFDMSEITGELKK